MNVIKDIIKRIENGEFYGNCYECERHFLEEEFIEYLKTIKSRETSFSISCK